MIFLKLSKFHIDFFKTKNYNECIPKFRHKGEMNMFCPKCNSPIPDHSVKCPVCGELMQPNTPRKPMKTKSKTLAAILMLFGIGDLYLRQWKKFFIKEMVVLVLTLGIGTVIWQIVDTVRVLNGTINCDAKGTPLV